MFVLFCCPSSKALTTVVQVYLPRLYIRRSSGIHQTQMAHMRIDTLIWDKPTDPTKHKKNCTNSGKFFFPIKFTKLLIVLLLKEQILNSVVYTCYFLFHTSHLFLNPLQASFRTHLDKTALITNNINTLQQHKNSMKALLFSSYLH